MAQTPPTFARPVKNSVYDVGTLSWVPMVQPVVNTDTLNIAVTGTPLSVKEVRSTTPSQSTVNDTASNTTLLAANTNRLGATIVNDSSAALYVKLGATASLTSYSAKITSGGYFEVPYGYTGIIDGIWATDPNDGAARISELT